MDLTWEKRALEVAGTIVRKELLAFGEREIEYGGEYGELVETLVRGVELGLFEYSIIPGKMALTERGWDYGKAWNNRLINNKINEN